MTLALHGHGRSDVGRQREGNEDSLRVLRDESGTLLVVCDGMGGHEGGEIASDVAATTIVEVMRRQAALPLPAAIYSALVEANAAVVKAAQDKGHDGMGTTAVVVRAQGSQLHVGWVGDSRFYLFRAGAIVERSTDHTRVEAMIAEGLITRENAKRHPDAHILSMVLGGAASVQEGFRPEVWNEAIALQAGDVALLCSDGLYDLIADDELYPLMAGLDHKAAVERLIEVANERGGSDNVTVAILVAGEPLVPALAAALPELTQRVSEPPAMAVTAHTSHVPLEPAVKAAAAQISAGFAALGMAVTFVAGLAVGHYVTRVNSPPPRRYESPKLIAIEELPTTPVMMAVEGGDAGERALDAGLDGGALLDAGLTPVPFPQEAGKGDAGPDASTPRDAGVKAPRAPSRGH